MANYTIIPYVISVPRRLRAQAHLVRTIYILFVLTGASTGSQNMIRSVRTSCSVGFSHHGNRAGTCYVIQRIYNIYSNIIIVSYQGACARKRIYYVILQKIIHSNLCISSRPKALARASADITSHRQ